MDDKEVEKIVEQYVGAVNKVQTKLDQERIIGGMFHAQPPPPMSLAMLVNMALHRWLVPWSIVLVVPILLLILWRVW